MSSRRPPLFALVALVFALCTASVALATTVVQLDFEQLVKVSDLVVVGEVLSVEGVEDGGRVYTHVQVKVDETLKGAAREKLEIIHVGGRTDHLVTRVAGMPSFTVGERALLLLEQPKGYSHFVVTGLTQGKFRLSKHDDGSIELLPDAEPAHFLRPVKIRKADPDEVQAPTKLPQPTSPPHTLSEARSRIAAQLASPDTK